MASRPRRRLTAEQRSAVALQGSRRRRNERRSPVDWSLAAGDRTTSEASDLADTSTTL
jgi:hypothetical protein